MTIRADSMLLEPGSEIELFQLDGTVIDLDAGYLYFHPHNQEGVITFQGIDYSPWPMEARGFVKTGEKPENPTLSVANIDRAMTALCLLYDDMVGAVLTRKTTLSKYLDAVNFPGGINPTANPAEEFPPEIWYIDRKEHEDKDVVKWSLASAMDFNGVILPRRVIVANRCFWDYRGPECGYAGGPVAKVDNTPTSDPALDKCSKNPDGCKLRFGANNPLPYGSFPGSGLLRT